MFSYVNMCNCILNFWHLILYFPLHIHMEKLSLKITYYFITHIATEYEANPTTRPCLYQKPLTAGFPLRCLLPEPISLFGISSALLSSVPRSIFKASENDDGRWWRSRRHGIGGDGRPASAVNSHCCNFLGRPPWRIQ